MQSSRWQTIGGPLSRVIMGPMGCKREAVVREYIDVSGPDAMGPVRAVFGRMIGTRRGIGALEYFVVQRV
jgi:hypothetical protein